MIVFFVEKCIPSVKNGGGAGGRVIFVNDEGKRSGLRREDL
jgi:hypothetical protein